MFLVFFAGYGLVGLAFLIGFYVAPFVGGILWANTQARQTVKGMALCVGSIAAGLLTEYFLLMTQNYESMLVIAIIFTIGLFLGSLCELAAKQRKSTSQ